MVGHLVDAEGDVRHGDTGRTGRLVVDLVHADAVADDADRPTHGRHVLGFDAAAGPARDQHVRVPDRLGLLLACGGLDEIHAALSEQIALDHVGPSAWPRSAKTKTFGRDGASAPPSAPAAG